MQTRSHTTRVIDGKGVVFDEEGFLLDPESWTETIAETLAGNRDIYTHQTTMGDN